MMRQLEHFNILHRRQPGDLRLAFASHQKGLKPRRGAQAGSNAVVGFPRRPDAAVLSETIPLFYIGQNRHGCWVVREAEGRSGGLFICKQSALRFAQRQSAPGGCATMFVAGPLELDIENEGNDLVDSMSVVINAAARYAPNLANFVVSMVWQWRKLMAKISHAMAGERRHRAAIERELFHDQYKLSSKNDDDLPIVD
jgi:hypothetical protein